MSDIALDTGAFYARTRQLIGAWNDNTDDEWASLAQADKVLILAGDPDEEGSYKKSTALQTWLLGYEFPSTLILFSKDGTVTFLCSPSKAKILQQLIDKKVKDEDEEGLKVIVQLKIRNPKDAAGAAAAVKETVDILVEGGKKSVGSLIKEKHRGKFHDEWSKAVEKESLEFVDVASCLSSAMGVKDSTELGHLATAALLNSTLMSNYFVDKMTSTIENDRKLTHEKFAALVEAKIGTEEQGPEEKLWSKEKKLANVDFSSVDWIYTPIIQSGGTYDLKPSAESDGRNLKAGVILGTIGLRVRSYCSNMGRTFLIDPAKAQEKNYAFLLELQKYALTLVKDGAVVKDVVSKVADYVREKKPELADFLVKPFGARTGLEFRDSTFLLSAKNGKTFKANEVVNLQLSFAGLPTPKSQKDETYALQLIDTVKVGKEGGVVLTAGCKSLDEVVFYMNGDEEEKKSKSPKKKASRPSPVKQPSGYQVGNKVLRGKTRNEGVELDQSAQQQLKEHQRILHEQRQERGLERFAEGGDGKGGEEKKVWKRYESYKKEDQLPKQVASFRIYVDDSRQTIVLPVNGFATPFHINTIKNASKSEEGEYTYLRINFNSPGQIAGKKEDTPFEDPNATFIRSATFRSTDNHHFSQVYDQITKMRAMVTKREKDKKELADVVEQEKLRPVRQKRPLVLNDVMIRPGPDNKKLAGDLQIHENGVRYQNHNNQQVDLLFSNIKHLFFQPCDDELIVVIHIHLKAPIMIGKKKAKDVQFIREATDVAFDETGNRKRKYRYGDEDEIQLEQEERKRRAALNKEFKAFAEKIAQAAEGDFEVDIPFRELGFQGVPFRTNVLLQPTTDALVQLTELPSLVITLSEVEIVHFERVQHGLKQFDLVFVFSDFTRAPQHVNSIPFGQLEGIKEWLDSCDLPISEGAVNLTWTQIMRTVNEDPYSFFAEGGWSFLGGGDQGSDSDMSESGSEFDAGSDDSAVSSNESTDDESDFDSDASDDSGSAVSDESDGESWDELERKAGKSDDKKRQAKADAGSDSDGDDRRKNSSKGKGRR